MNRSVILFRGSLTEEYELNIAKKYFPVITQRTTVKAGDLVIPRYSALPYYKEFEADIEHVGGKLINSYREHCYVANLKNWYYDLIDYTPKTWFALEQIPKEGPFVLKGETNSKKHFWNTHMFAKNKHEAGNVHSRLTQDELIGSQDIYIRQYVPLKKLCNGIQGIPVSEEYRFFVLDGKIVSSGFYWSEHSDYIKNELKIDVNPDFVPDTFLNEVISIVSPNIRFFVIDIAKTETDNWIVVELNDASMSGLSDNNPNVLYYNMVNVL